MKTVGFFGLVLGMLAMWSQADDGKAQNPSASDAPLMDFVSVPDNSARDEPPKIERCGYYLQVRGSTEHEAGNLMGAAVQVRNDSVTIRIGSYPASDIVIHEIERSRWTLRIGELGFRRYHVEVTAGRYHESHEEVLAQQSC